MWKSSFAGETLPAGLDPALLYELQLLMQDEFPLLLHTFISDARRMLAEITAAIGSDDADRLRRVAHSLKGSSVNLGAGRLVAELQRLEDLALARDLYLARTQAGAVNDACTGVIDALQRLLSDLRA